MPSQANPNPCRLSSLRIRTGEVFDEIRNRKNGLKILDRELAPGKVAEHQIGAREAHIYRHHQTIVRPDMKKRWLASTCRLTSRPS